MRVLPPALLGDLHQGGPSFPKEREKLTRLQNYCRITADGEPFPDIFESEVDWCSFGAGSALNRVRLDDPQRCPHPKLLSEFDSEVKLTPVFLQSTAARCFCRALQRINVYSMRYDGIDFPQQLPWDLLVFWKPLAPHRALHCV